MFFLFFSVSFVIEHIHQGKAKPENMSTVNFLQITGAKSIHFIISRKKPMNKDGNLGGGFKYFSCSSLPGEVIQFD